MNHNVLTKTAIGAALAGAMLVAGTAQAAPMTSIADSWHNLGAGNSKGVTPNGGSPANHTTDTAEICVFCHTPHGGDNAAAVPIWNRKLNDPQIYTRYSSLGTATFDAEETEIGSVTIACLSCHDGTQAIDQVINAPGSGGYDPNGARIGGGAGFGGADQVNGQLATGIVQNLGTDLSNDHPVSMQYAGGGINAGAPQGPSRDPDFVAGNNPKAHPSGFTLNTMAAPANNKFSTLWWIERGTDSLNDAGRDRTDVIFYTRTDANIDGGAEQPFVECGSCHDPHNIDNPTFLRVSNGVAPAQSGDFPTPNGGPSGLCLTCHIK